MICNSNKVKDKYKVRIDKGEKYQMNLKDDLKREHPDRQGLIKMWYRCTCQRNMGIQEREADTAI